MPGEVKQRKKKQSDHVAADPANKQDEDKKVNRERVGTPPKTSTLDLKFLMFQTAGVLYLVSVHLTLDDVGARQQAARAQLESLERDVGQLKEWESWLSNERSELRSSVAALSGAVDQIEARTSAITVASVRTDVRRMDGLRSELDSLLTQVSELEAQASRAERSMVGRIGDVLAGSIERVSNLRAASERNAQALEQLRQRLPELDAADRSASERLRELEGGRARLIRTVSFAADLKPKVGAIKRDFGALEPRLADLTFRVGSLAEELGKREEEIAELRHTLDELQEWRCRPNDLIDPIAHRRSC
uniref:IKBKB interacting protein n=1 Tax=Hippocampus comes TaxID=109280 RepID=A0A3Q3DUK5_HIPCM